MVCEVNDVHGHPPVHVYIIPFKGRTPVYPRIPPYGGRRRAGGGRLAGGGRQAGGGPQVLSPRGILEKKYLTFRKKYMLKKNKEIGPETYLTTSGTQRGFRELNS